MKMKTQPTMMGLMAVVALLSGVAAAADPPDAGHRNRPEQIRALDRQHRDAFGDSPDHLVLPGLLADRSRQQVTFYAEATDVSDTDPVEFFLIGPESGHGYEAAAMAHVKPGHLRRGLVFLGMQPGRPVDFGALRFWPKGERVVAHCAWKEAEGGMRRVRLEQLVVDRADGKPLPASGLVFTGSQFVAPPGPDAGTNRVLAADVYDPFSIAANYNEPASLLDVPRQAVQGDVYRDQTLNANLQLPTNRLLTITLQPEFTNGHQRVMDVTLEVAAGADDDSGAKLDDLSFTLRRGSTPLAAQAELADVVRTFQSLVEKQHDPFVTFMPGPDVCLVALRTISRVLRGLEGENGIRMEPPPAGHLYYRAFDPPEAYKDREERISQPWELKLRHAGGELAATLVHIEQLWTDDSLRPDLEIEELPVPTPGDTAGILASRENDLSVILVYAPADVTYGQLMQYVRPVLERYAIIHVFVE